MPMVKLPLASELDSRDSSLDKDGLITNAFLEAGIEGNINVVKRPGLNLNIFANGVGLGVYHYGDITFQFFDAVSTDTFLEIAYGNNVFVISTGKEALVSSDGASWETYALPQVTFSDPLIIDGQATGLKFVNGYFWILSPVQPDSSIEGTSIVYRSSNGKNWDTIILPIKGNKSHIAYGNGTYIITGDTGDAPNRYLRYWRSSDGTTWTYTDTTDNKVFAPVTFNGTSFVRISNANTFVSNDSITWTTYTHGGTSVVVSEVYSNTSSGLIVARTSTGIYYSSDTGVTRTFVSLGSTTSDLFFDGTWFVVLMDSGAVTYSANGSVWSGATAISSNLAMNGNHTSYVAIKTINSPSDNKVSISSDLITWTTFAVPTYETSTLVTRN